MDVKKLIVVYIARASSPRHDTTATKAWLQVSLSAVCHDHDATFELPIHDTQFLTFIHHSNVALPRNGLVIARIAEIYEQARNTTSDVLLVLSGWDGLTTNGASIIDLFHRMRPANTPRVMLRVYGRGLNGAPGFHDADPDAVCAVLLGERNPSTLQASDIVFLGNLTIAHDAKTAISGGHLQVSR